MEGTSSHRFQCPFCPNEELHRHQMEHHIRRAHNTQRQDVVKGKKRKQQEEEYKCTVCGEVFHRRQSLTHHMDRQHGRVRFRQGEGLLPAKRRRLLETYKKHLEDPEAEVNTCHICGESLKQSELRAHILSHVPSAFDIREEAFNGVTTTYRRRFGNNSPYENTLDALEGERLNIWRLVRARVQLDRVSLIRINVVLSIIRVDDEGNVVAREYAHVQSPHHLAFGVYNTREDFIQKYNNLVQNMVLAEENLHLEGSNWKIEFVDELHINITSLNGIKGRCSLDDPNFVPWGYDGKLTCMDVVHKNPHVKKIQSPNGACFYYAVGTELFRNVKRCYPRNQAELDTFIRENLVCDLNTPMSISEITMFEKQNFSKYPLAINVLFLDNILEGGTLYPAHCSRNYQNPECFPVNLVIYDAGFSRGTKETIFHFDLVTNADRFVAQQRGRKVGQTCLNCLTSFEKSENFVSHQELCLQSSAQRLVLMDPKHKKKFYNQNREFLNPIFGVADFEAANYDPSNLDQKGVLKEQKAVSFCLMFYDFNGKLIYHKEGKGEDCLDQFMVAVEESSHAMWELLKRNENMIFTAEDARDFRRAKR